MNRQQIAAELVAVARELSAGLYDPIWKRKTRGGVTIEYIEGSRGIKNLENVAEGFGKQITDDFKVTLPGGEQHVIHWSKHGQGGFVKLDDKPGALAVSKGKAFRWRTKNLSKPMEEWIEERFPESDDFVTAMDLIHEFYHQFYEI